MFSCRYCKKLKPEVVFECHRCGENVHINCLKTVAEPPSSLLGDVFFVFQCQVCSSNNIEQFERDKMAWVDVVLLTLYNLKREYPTWSRDGFFHWQKHIKKFISQHWRTIFPHMRTKRKSWSQMIITTLRSYNKYFICGDGILPNGMNGWYRLARSDMLPTHALLERKVKKRKRLYEENENSNAGFQAALNEDSTSRESSSQETPLGVSSLSTLYSESSSGCENMYSRSYVKPTPILSHYLFAGEDMEEDIDIEAMDIDNAVDIRTASTSEILPFTTQVKPVEVKVEAEELGEVIKEEPDTEVDSEPEQQKVMTPSLLTRSDRPGYLPWVKKPFVPFENCRAMTESEELYLLSTLSRKISESEQVSVADYRLHRKLKVRKLKRERGLAVFDIDSGGQATQQASGSTERRILDRFIQRNLSTPVEDDTLSFRTKLLGHREQYTCFVSPYTMRTLKPFIRRDYESYPLWLKLLDELQQKVNGKQNGWSPPPRAPIDYTYVRPHHIPAVNSLAQQYFWPGINLAECLQYPDFSCVTLYKKLVIGFAFLVPDVGYNEAYVSFIFTRPEWRRAGIATFMLYHLIQTCMGRDITLHVSAENPAILFYQKFGFKVEEFVQDFYDRYLTIDSTESKHALFLRLSR